MKLKCWITRQGAFSIQCGGLERLFVHFSKPTYLLEKLTENQRDTPFGYVSESESGLYNRHGWIELDKKSWVHKQSVGQWLGYDNEVSEYIWDKLCEHFNNEPFGDWDKLEKEGVCKVEDFLLEMELNVNL